MKKFLFSGVIILFLLLLTGAECDNCDNGALADLVPVKPNPSIAGPIGYCDIVVENDIRYLKVHIKNQGTGDASASTTKVDFGAAFGIQTVATPGITAGTTLTVLVPTPSGVFNPDMTFTITVDSTDSVNESNEGNNSADGFCLG